MHKADSKATNRLLPGRVKMLKYRFSTVSTILRHRPPLHLFSTMAVEPKYVERTSETVRDVAADVIRLLKKAGETVGVAESLTGGGIMATITSVSGASSVFRGGIVSYATPLKQHLLNVDGDIIAQHGVIHEDVAQQMAAGARTATSTDTPTTWGIGTTGVAGPDSQDGKPVGMVFIGIASPEQARGRGPFHFPGDRDQVRQATILEALAQLRKELVAREERN